MDPKTDYTSLWLNARITAFFAQLDPDTPDDIDFNDELTGTILDIEAAVSELIDTSANDEIIEEGEDLLRELKALSAKS